MELKDKKSYAVFEKKKKKYFVSYSFLQDMTTE